MLKLINKLAYYNTVTFLMITLGVLFLFFAFSFFVIAPWYENLFRPIKGPQDYLVDMPLYMMLIMTVLVAPLIETFLVQFLVIYLLLRFTRFPLWLVICTSALIFSVIHYYGVFYALYAFVGGMIFAFAFVTCKQKKGYFYAFCVVALIHGLFNATLVLSQWNFSANGL